MGLFDGAIGNVLNNLGGAEGAEGAPSSGNSILRMVMSLLQEKAALGVWWTC